MTSIIRPARVAAFAAIFLSTISHASAINFFKKPLEAARKATESVGKVNTSTDAAKQVVAQQATAEASKRAVDARIDTIATEAKQAIKELKTAEEALAIQKNMFFVALAGLVLTNTFTLGGLLKGRRKTDLEIKKLLLDIEERELAIKELKRKSATDDPDVTI